MKLRTANIALLAMLPLSACAKSQEAMCTDIVRQGVRLTVLENAPLNAGKEMIELRIEQIVSNPSKGAVAYKDCVNGKKITQKQYECIMKANTIHAGEASG